MKKNKTNIVLLDTFTEKNGFDFKMEDVLFLMAASNLLGKMEAVKMLKPVDAPILNKVLEEFEKEKGKIKEMFEKQGLAHIYEEYKKGWS